jgi:hypothetical protein
MPTVSQRIHYQASEQGRDGVQIVDTRGREITKAEAIASLGGDKKSYVELVSDASRLETEALCARHPNTPRDKVLADHFSRQARLLDPSGKAVIAVHLEPDNSYHAHIILPGKEQEYPKLEGRNAAAQKAWDKAWNDQKQRHKVENWALENEAKKLNVEAKDLRKEANALAKNKRSNDPSADVRVRHQETIAKQRIDVENRLHEVNLQRLEKTYAARGQMGSLEHLVEVETERHRHTGALRQADRILVGANREKMEREQRELFRHLSAEERKPHREKALIRDVGALNLRFQAELKEAGDYEKSDLEARHARVVEAALLRHEANLLRDKEGDAAKQMAKKSFAKSVFGASADPVRDLMLERQELERRALHVEAEGRGKETPDPSALTRLEARHERERLSLDERVEMRHLTGSRRAEWREAIYTKQVALAMETATMDIAQRPGQKDAIETRLGHTLAAMEADHKAAMIRDQERDLRSRMSLSEVLKHRGTDRAGDAIRDRLKSNLTRFAAGRAAFHGQAFSLMSERHKCEIEALTSRARAVGREPDPKDMKALQARQLGEKTKLTATIGKDTSKTVTKTPKKMLKKGLQQAPKAAMKALEKLQKAAKTTRDTKANRDLDRVKSGAEGVALTAAQAVTTTAVTAIQETAQAAIHQAKHAVAAGVEVSKAVAAAVATANPLVGLQQAGQGLSRVGAEAGKDLAQDAISGAKNTVRDAAQGAKQTTEQALASVTSMGMAAAPEEIQAAMRALKELMEGSAKTVKSAVTLDLVGTLSNAGGTLLGVTKEAAKMVRVPLPMPVDKALDLAAKLPLIGLAAKASKLVAEMGMGGAALSKSIDLDR